MTPKILTTPHWKLFILVFGLPFVGMLIAMITTISLVISQRNEPSPEMMLPVMIIFPAIALFGAIIQLYWQWSIATRLQAYMHPDMRKLRVKRFKVFFFIPWVYFTVMMLVMSIITTQIDPVNNEPSPSMMWLIPLIILAFLMHFFSMFCLIYSLYFTAKTLKSAEMQCEAHFSDYIGDFFLLWFYPVGIWFIQPRVNRIVQGDQLKDTSLID